MCVRGDVDVCKWWCIPIHMEAAYTSTLPFFFPDTAALHN